MSRKLNIKKTTVIDHLNGHISFGSSFTGIPSESTNSGIVPRVSGCPFAHVKSILAGRVRNMSSSCAINLSYKR